MNIYLVRHGEAENISPGKSDSARELTPDGVKTVHNAANGWMKLFEKLDYIVSSPLLRAKQTAQIIGEVYGISNNIIIDPVVISGDAEELLRFAVSLKANDICFCGHEPDFSRYVSELISGGQARIVFKKAMIARVAFEGRPRIGAGYLEFMIPAKAYKTK